MAERNPAWAADELILALDLYLRHGALGAAHPEVVQLSAVLNALPIHTVRPDVEKFRNPNGVALKLASFQALDPSYSGVGMTRGGRLDAEVWDRYCALPDLVARLASALRAGVDMANAFPVAPEEDEAEAVEGRLLYRRHRARERNRALIQRKKRAAPSLSCEACGFDFEQTYGNPGRGFIECHHLVPLSETGTTTPSWLILPCCAPTAIASPTEPGPGSA